MQLAQELLDRINQSIEDNQPVSFRNHLGASLIGDECLRKLWYTFHWAKRVKHDGRLLRLFSRGHEEEPRLVKWLKGTGMSIWEVNEHGNQFKCVGYKGHFGGSLDGVGMFEGEPPFLLEFKTSGDKPYAKLVKEGVAKAKPVHFAQMQIYMGAYSLTRALYVAVNKNNDDLHLEWVDFDQAECDRLNQRAQWVIDANEAPERIAGASTGNFICRFCDFKNICFAFEAPDRNCRTCAHSTPVANGEWSCVKDGYIDSRIIAKTVNDELLPSKCNEYLLNGTMIGRIEDVEDRPLSERVAEQLPTNHVRVPSRLLVKTIQGKMVTLETGMGKEEVDELL